MTTGNRGKKKSKKRKVRRGQFKKLRKKFTKKKIFLKGGMGVRELRLNSVLNLDDVGHNADGQLEREDTKKHLDLDTEWKYDELDDFVKRTKRIENMDELRQFHEFLILQIFHLQILL